jgi:hypothetical protein
MKYSLAVAMPKAVYLQMLSRNGILDTFRTQGLSGDY